MTTTKKHGTHDHIDAPEGLHSFWQVSDAISYSVRTLDNIARALRVVGNNVLAQDLLETATDLEEARKQLDAAVMKSTADRLREAQQGTANLLSLAVGMLEREK